MKLAFKKMGKGQPMVILHGLFGSSDNWQTLGKEFAEKFEVYLIDQRNHGHSPHSDDFSYELMAQDLKELFEDENIQNAIVIGHSMGGKTAMRFAQLYPEFIDKLIIADMGIKAYAPGHEDIFEAMYALDLSKIESRKEAETAIKPYIPNFSVRQFILKNLYRKTKTDFGWRVNFEVLDKQMDEILAALPANVVTLPTLFIYGKKSDYIKPDEFDEIKKTFPNANFSGLPAGHWLHAEDAEGFYKEVIKFVTSETEPA